LDGGLLQTGVVPSCLAAPSAGKSIHYIEFGVGGGTSANGDKKATTAEGAAFTPFFGEQCFQLHAM
jgi:hypothetical protein